MKKAVFIFCLLLFHPGCMDMSLTSSYQREHFPELVNYTSGALELITVFKYEDETGRKRLYRHELPVGSAFPVWLDNHRGPSYLVGSFRNAIEEVLVSRGSGCADILAGYPGGGEVMREILLDREELANFLGLCRPLLRISGVELERIRQAVSFYGPDATCLLIREDGALEPVRESDILPQTGPGKLEPGALSRGLPTFCARSGSALE